MSWHSSETRRHPHTRGAAALASQARQNERSGEGPSKMFEFLQGEKQRVKN